MSLTGKAFIKSNQALQAKLVDLKQQGKGAKPNKSLAITPEEESILWEKGEFGTDNPKALQFCVFYTLGKCLGLRGRESYRQILFGDLEIQVDASGQEYIQYTERATKTRDGSNPKEHSRDSTPRIYGNTHLGERNPISLFKNYINHRPKEACEKHSPLFLTPIPDVRLKGDIWYYATPMGENTLGKLLKNACQRAGIPGKKTNHSLRKTTVKTLQRAKIPPHKIMQVKQ